MAKRTPYPRLSPAPTEGEGPSYEVGYGKPPKHTRFRPGQSGNPMGRPRGAKNRSNRIPALNEERMKTVVQEEAYRVIAIRDGDRLVEIPVIQAIIRSVALNAAKGLQGSQRIFTDLLQWVEHENKVLHDEWLNSAIEYKTSWERELEARERHGRTGPDPLPHPDDIVINMQSGQVEIRGPLTKEEKEKWEHARTFMAEHDELILDLEKLIAKNPKDKEYPRLLEQQRRIGARLAAAVGPYATRVADTESRKAIQLPEPDSDPRVVSFDKNRK